MPQEDNLEQPKLLSHTNDDEDNVTSLTNIYSLVLKRHGHVTS